MKQSALDAHCTGDSAHLLLVHPPCNVAADAGVGKAHHVSHLRTGLEHLQQAAAQAHTPLQHMLQHCSCHCAEHRCKCAEHVCRFWFGMHTMLEGSSHCFNSA